MSEAAQMLGLTRRILGLRMKQHGIDYKDFRIAKRD
jgi:transcriptional regulator with GAF, ATPase, and Fis domain